MSMRAFHLLPLFLVVAACGPEDGKTTADSSSASTEPATGSTDASTSEPTGATDPSGATDSGSAGTTIETPTTGESSGSSTGEPDFVRECQPDDFKCEDWGCERGDVVVLSQCYKPCTPSVIGEPDDECDEPGRPFCSQVGQALGGDFDCNACAHICVSESFNQCNQAADACP